MFNREWRAVIGAEPAPIQIVPVSRNNLTAATFCWLHVHVRALDTPRGYYVPRDPNSVPSGGKR